MDVIADNFQPSVVDPDKCITILLIVYRLSNHVRTLQSIVWDL